MTGALNGDDAKTPFMVKRLEHKGAIDAVDAGRVLAEQTDENAIECVNWPEFPYRPKVSFRMGHVQNEIWLRFDVSEERVRGLESRMNGDVHKDSCVEFFVSFDRVYYYNLEVNCIGTKHLGYGPSRHARKFVSAELMGRIGVHSSLGDKPFDEKSGGFDWQMTMKVPLAVFMFDGLANLNGLVAEANLYKTGCALAEPHYLSWAPVSTSKPDYHQPEYFRAIRFE